MDTGSSSATENQAETLDGRVCVCLHFEGDHDAGGGGCRAELGDTAPGFSGAYAAVYFFRGNGADSIKCWCGEFAGFDEFRAGGAA